MAVAKMPNNEFGLVFVLCVYGFKTLFLKTLAKNN